LLVKDKHQYTAPVPRSAWNHLLVPFDVNRWQIRNFAGVYDRLILGRSYLVVSEVNHHHSAVMICSAQKHL